MSYAVPIALIAIAAVSAYVSYDQQQQMVSEQKKANQIDRQGQDAAVRRARVQEIAQARRQRAVALSITEASGVNTVGSSVLGGVNSVQSQSAGNQAFLTSQKTFRDAAGRHLDKAGSHASNAGKADALSSTSLTALNLYGNRGAYGFG